MKQPPKRATASAKALQEAKDETKARLQAYLRATDRASKQRAFAAWQNARQWEEAAAKAAAAPEY